MVGNGRKVKMTKVFLVSFLAVFILLCCMRSWADTVEEPVTLKLFEMPDPKSADPFSQAEWAVIRAFQKKYPYIELKPFSGISIKGIGDANALLAIAGGTSPDVIYVNFRQSETYIQRGFLAPMDEYLKNIPEDLQNLRVAKPVWPVIRRKGPDGKEHVYALPYGLLVRVLCYRKDLFARVGLNPERAPRDWNELYEYARKLTNSEHRTYGLFMYSGPASTSWDFIIYLWSAGGEAVVQDENGEWRAVFDSDEAVEALLFYLKLITTEWTDPSEKSHEGVVLRSGMDDTAWEEGRLGMKMMYLNEKSIGGGIDPSIIGIAPVPFGPTGLRGSELNCYMMGIFAGQKDKRVRDAAWKYIWFYDSEEARKIRLEVMVEYGYGKFMNPVYLKRFGYKEYLEDVPETWLPVFEEAMASGIPEPYGKNCQMVYNFMTYPIDRALALEYRGKLGGTDEEKRKKIKELLVSAVERTNKEMIGKLSDADRNFRNKVALIVAVIVLSVFCFVLWRVWNIFTPKGEGMPKGWGFKKYWPAYVIMLPAVASILLWMYTPMFMGSKMAFQDYQIVRDSSWVGLGNFADVIFDITWWKSVWRTFYYMILMLGLGFWPPILLAILLQEVSRGKIIYRTIFYLPAVISGFVVIYLWRLFYDPTDVGVLNQILGFLGIENQRWLGDERLAMLCCVIPSVWAGMGHGCLIYLAALKGITDE